MTRKDLALAIRDRLGIKATVNEMSQYVDATLECISEALAAGRHLEFRGFGTLEVVTRKARLGRNPRAPEKTYKVPERRVVAFKPAAGLLAAVEKSEPEKGVRSKAKK